MNLKIFVLIIFFVLLIFYVMIFVQPYSFLRIIKGSKEYAAYLVQKAGIEKINEETEQIFDDFYKRSVRMHALTKEDLSRHPALLNFPGVLIVAISGPERDKSMQASIVIKYGTHAMADFIYIFDKRTPSPYFDALKHKNLWKITDNIYLVVN